MGLVRTWLWFVLSFASFVIFAAGGCVPRGGQQPAYGSPGYAQPAAQVEPTPACQHACFHYFECKGGSAEPTVGAQCVQDCRASGVDPNAVEALAGADCITVIGTFDSGGGPPDGAIAAATPAPAQPAAASATTTTPAAVVVTPGAPVAAPAAVPAAVPAAAPAPAPASSGCGAPGNNPLSQLLVSSAWCHVAYAGGISPGIPTQERLVFAVDGRFMNNNAAQGCWRADGSALQLTVGGQSYAPVQLQVTRDSNGYPSINAGGKEYSSCQ